MSDLSTNPTFALPTSSIAGLPLLKLSLEELKTANFLAGRLGTLRPVLELSNLYYDGLQKMQDLGIAIPPSLSRLRTVIGWPRIGVDALSNRCRVEGFRYPSASGTDEDLWGIWQANNLDGEAQLAHLDALIYGRSYILIGTGNESTQDLPLITAESPIHMAAIWDPRMRQCTAALQLYVDVDLSSDMYGQEIAALYLPDSTIHLARGALDLNGLATRQEPWSVTDRDDHKLGRVPVVRMANRCRTSKRDGMSEITPEWRNTTDSANRTLLGMEITREFYSAPRRYILGASEEDFKKSDGSAVTAWESYLSKVWAITANEEGDLPTVGEFKAADPATHTKLLDEYAKIMSGEMGVPPHFLGVYSDGNPASADAIRSGYEELVVRARNKHVHFGDAWEEALRLALMIRGDGSLPDGANRIETDWADPSPATPVATAQAIYQQVEGGMIPPYSDVTLKKLGYSASERARLAEDREHDDGLSFLNELAHSIIAKDAKVDTTIATDLGAPAPGAAPGAPAKLPVALPKNGA